MRILWLCNIMLPVIAESLGLPCSNKEGWLSGLAAAFSKGDQEDVMLGVCFPVSGQCCEGETDGLVWYGFPEDTAHPERYDALVETYLKKILDKFKPDIVHCFGTEYPHTLAMTRAFHRPERTLIGIQGLCFVYADYYMSDLPDSIQDRKTFRDMVKKDDLCRQQQKYRMRGEYEKEALRNTAHVTGRTGWDRRWTKEINPRAAYHFLNETLRDSFYGPIWKPEHCERYSIFVSQGNYPIKGLHYLMEALPEIRKKYSQVHVYVAGDEITRFSTWKEKIKISNYGKYIRELIKRLRLEDAVTFLGRLDERQMLERYLRSHVFVSPSAIENSPNSVGEAMLLGMPVVSSAVGGVRDMLVCGKEGFLYETNDTAALAGHICHIFDRANEKEVNAMGRAAREHAFRTHDGVTNRERLREIYHEIYLCV